MTYSDVCKKYRNFLIDKKDNKWAIYNLYMYNIKDGLSSVKEAKKYIDNLFAGDYQMIEVLRNKRS